MGVSSIHFHTCFDSTSTQNWAVMLRWVKCFACTHQLLPPSIALSFRAQHDTDLWCPLYSLMASPVDRSQRRALQSEEAVTK